jgi:hypothetical protein
MAMQALEDTIRSCELDGCVSGQAVDGSKRLSLLQKCSLLLSRPEELEAGFRADDPRAMLPHFRLQERVDDLLRDAVRECVVDADVCAVCEESCPELSWSLPDTPAEGIREWPDFKAMKALLGGLEQRIPPHSLQIRLAPLPEQPSKQLPADTRSTNGVHSAKPADRSGMFMQQRNPARRVDGDDAAVSGMYTSRSGWSAEEEANKRRKTFQDGRTDYSAARCGPPHPSHRP